MSLTLTLPSPLARRAERLATVEGRDVETVVLDLLQTVLPPDEEDLDLPEWMHQATEGELEAAMTAQMPPARQRRLSELLSRGNEGTLTPAEREELETLLLDYQAGTLRMAQARYALALRRSRARKGRE